MIVCSKCLCACDCCVDRERGRLVPEARVKDLEVHLEELIAEAFGVTEGIAPDKRLVDAILQIRALYEDKSKAEERVAELERALEGVRAYGDDLSATVAQDALDGGTGNPVSTVAVSAEDFFSNPREVNALAERVGRVIVLDSSGATRLVVNSNRVTEAMLDKEGE